MLSRSTRRSAIALIRCAKPNNSTGSNVLIRAKHTRANVNLNRRNITNSIPKPRQVAPGSNKLVNEKALDIEDSVIPTEEANDIVSDLETVAEAKDVNKRISGRSPILLGDFVEAFQNGQYSGVVVGQRSASGGRQVLTILLKNGKTREFSSTTIAHVVPRFIQNDVRLRNFSFDPSAGTMPNDTYPVADFSRRISEYQRTIQLRKGLGLKRLSDLHNVFRSMLVANSIVEDRDVSYYDTFSLETLAQWAFNTRTPSTEQLHATFLHLINDNVNFIPTINVRTSGLWMFRPKKETKLIQEITESVRSNDEAYTGFIRRAKQLVEFYQAHADPLLGTFSHASLDVAKASYNLTETDAKFINFIADWVKSPATGIHTPHEIFAPTILKGLGCYSDHLFVDRGLAMQFLKQIGMFKPWDNSMLIQNAGNLVDDYVWSDKATKMDETMERHANIFLQGQLDQSGFHARDPCDAIRHDFGDMPVYTIDDQAAKEIDDGISIERIPGSNGDDVWLHVHIADPSAYIPPTHELAKVMEQRGQTLYLPEQHFPILPSSLASEKFSLGSSAHTNSNGSQYALTFSARLNKAGDMQAWKLRPSLVKNVKKLYYSDVDEFILPHAADTVPSEPLVDFNKKFAHPTSIPPLHQASSSSSSSVTKECEQDLLDIFKLTSQHSRFRFDQGALNFVRPNPYVELEPQPLALPNIHFASPSLSYASTLPVVRVGLDNSSISPAKRMVAEAMIMGGRIASHYAQEHGVIIPHRTQTWPDNASNTDIELRQHMLNERDSSTGVIGLRNVLQYLGILPPASISTTSGLPHILMGIPNGYVKATSPLRRYLDIVTHWQLKAHLLKEPAPFTQDRLETVLIPRMEAREKQLSFLQQDCLQYWVIELMQRLMADSHGKELEWTCLVNTPNRASKSELGGATETARATIMELGLRARIQNLKTSLHTGDVVKTRVAKLDSFRGFVDLELV
ncbi:hypothetical protein BDB00DRAFT_24860 [Zychaea mexicana]|uniref:uncharacterized protein n=1 Tax=Zychaea mexicana TaxID=64656 RepID=UPI0022FE00EF|nr:uncharacterized protein BDB00DRAFT_24860 [Zychaea mexicana]KAI9488826.1 hypothetical protein BDB00DRAFT_24860 [Zychaea mexicana]